MLNIEAIIIIVERGQADKVIKEARKAGAKGATVMYGRGVGDEVVKKFINIDIQASKEIIIILSQKETVRNILTAAEKAGNLHEPGTGIAFTLPVDNLIGLGFREI